MREGHPDIDAVTALIYEVAAELVLPRFRNLAATDIERKETATDPDDVVTVVDRETEARLTEALVALLPGSVVIGEEATHAHPELLDELSSDGPLWLLDPIDGTKNFAAGGDGFGVMLGYAWRGQTRAAWILLPARDEMFVAEQGAGVRLNGVPRKVSPALGGERLRGVMHMRYMPSALRKAAKVAGGRAASVDDARSAAVEYTDILVGRRDFAVYYRLLPWDHAAPGLIVTEAGGCSVHKDGTSYGPRSADQLTIVARGRDTADQVRVWFES